MDLEARYPESKEDEDEKEEDNLLYKYGVVQQKKTRPSYELLHWTAHILMIFLYVFSVFRPQYQPNGFNGESKPNDYTPMWSPVMEVIKGTGHFVRFDGSFARPNAFKGRPSLDIDESWDRVTRPQGGVISISEETLKAVNVSKEYAVKLPSSAGGGYMASVEVLHQLHCLNFLRKATYEDYYKNKSMEWTDSPETLRHHLDHCIDNLRQKLMCDADTGIITFVWVKGHSAPSPNFNVQHKCRKLDPILDWVIEQEVVIDNYKENGLAGTQELESYP